MLTEKELANFWKKVQKTETCWLWTSKARANGGYGAFCAQGKTHKAHRLSLELALGRELAAGMDAAHGSCHNPLCVNPDHLSEKTRVENCHDRIRDRSNGRKLTLEQARAIRSDTRSQRQIASDYGISQYMVWAIKHGKNWSE